MDNADDGKYKSSDRHPMTLLLMDSWMRGDLSVMTPEVMIWNRMNIKI